MCETCGCGDSQIVSVDVHARILAGNDRQAAHNREHFDEARVVAVNLMGSPGSGKTALLEATARRLGGRRRFSAVSGDLATERDAQRLRASGIASVAITTGSACHLDAEMVHHALHDVPWQDSHYFFVENVGNLVCPAIYDLGQHVNVVALAVTEGEDKPLKYPIMFRKADAVVLTKTDLLPALPKFNLRALRDALCEVMPEPVLMAVSSESGKGIERWVAWLEDQRQPTGGIERRAVEVAQAR